MKKLLFMGVAAVVALMPMWAHADTVLDPLHAYTFVGGVPTNTDNGVVTPLSGNPISGFGFDVSPNNQAGDFLLAILTPNTSAAISSINITGTLSGLATFAGVWTTGTLGNFLGLPGVQPNNSINNGNSPWPTPVGFTGYDVNVVDFGTQSLVDLASSTMNLSEGAALPLDSIIVAFLVQGNSTIGTANSGAGFEPTPFAVPTPIMGSGWQMASGLALFGALFFFIKRRRQRENQVSVFAAA